MNHWYVAVTGFSAVVMATPAVAEKLVYIAASNSGSEYYYDADSVRVSGKKVSVWQTINAKKDRSVRYRLRKMKSVFDCELENMYFTSTVTYGPDMNLLEQFEFAEHERQIASIVPGTISYELFNILCARTENQQKP